MQTGNRLHSEYIHPFKSFERRLLLNRLKVYGPVFKRKLDGIMIDGRPDDFAVQKNLTTFEKTVEIIEIKTTSRKRIFNHEIKMWTFQLALYIYVMTPILEQLGYKLNGIHYLYVFSQKTGELIRTFNVEADPDIEAEIRHIIAIIRGEKPMSMPPKIACRTCPKSIREGCWYFKGSKLLRKGARLI